MVANCHLKNGKNRDISKIICIDFSRNLVYISIMALPSLSAVKFTVTVIYSKDK